MKIVAILGTPHGMKGNTGTLLSEVILGAEKGGAAVATFSLASLQVRPCCACDTCHRTGACSITDDQPRIKSAMQAADGFILASPNYLVSVSAQMKALMDRCCGLLHCLAFEGKYGAAVVTSGGAGGDEVGAYLLRFLRSMGCWTVGSVAAEGGQLADKSARPQKLEEARSLGARLVDAIRIKAAFPDQKEARRAFYERMKQLISTQKDDWPYEYQYWKSLGRL